MVPVLVYFATKAIGGVILISGTDALLITAVVLAAACAIENLGAAEGRHELSPAPAVV